MNKRGQVIYMHSRDVMEVIYETIGKCVKNIILPVGNTLVPSVVLCFAIVIITCLCKVLDVYTFLDYRGTILAFLILMIQCYCERRSNNDILRLYNSIGLRAEEVKRGQARSGFGERTTGDKAGCGSGNDESGSGSVSSVQDLSRRSTGSADGSTISEWYEELDRKDEADDS